MGRPPIGKVAMTAAERVERWRRKHGIVKPAPKASAAAAAATIDALRTELAAAKARIVDLENVATALRGALNREYERKPHAPATPKAAKPPLPPDEARERIIKGLRTQVRNLTADVQAAMKWNQATRRSMDATARGTILKPLHSDTRKNLTGAKHLAGTDLEAALDAACKAFTAWITSLRPPAARR